MKTLVNSKRRDFIEAGDNIRLEHWDRSYYVQKVLSCTSGICHLTGQEHRGCCRENKGGILFEGFPNSPYCLSHKWVQCK